MKFNLTIRYLIISKKFVGESINTVLYEFIVGCVSHGGNVHIKRQGLRPQKDVPRKWRTRPPRRELEEAPSFSPQTQYKRLIGWLLCLINPAAVNIARLSVRTVKHNKNIHVTVETKQDFNFSGITHTRTNTIFNNAFMLKRVISKKSLGFHMGVCSQSCPSTVYNLVTLSSTREWTSQTDGVRGVLLRTRFIGNVSK